MNRKQNVSDSIFFMDKKLGSRICKLGPVLYYFIDYTLCLLCGIQSTFIGITMYMYVFLWFGFIYVQKCSKMAILLSCVVFCF